MINDREYQFVIGSLEVGGTETHITRVLPRLAERGYRVSALTYCRSGPLAGVLKRAGIYVKSNNLRPDAELRWWHPASWMIAFRCAQFLMNNLKRSEKSVACLFLPQGYLLGSLVHCLTCSRSRIIIFRRSLNNYQRRRRVLRWIEHKLHGYPDHFVGNSRSVSRQLIEEEGVSDRKVKLIYNGIDLREFDSAIMLVNVRTELSVSNSATVIVVVANLIPYKGHVDLLRALSLLPAAVQKDVVLVCVGGGLDARGDLIDLAFELALDKQIAWLGSRTDVPNVLSYADIGVLPSHEEGFSNAILEGMAAALPMVVTDVGGNSEAVIDGQTGFVVPSKNPQALAVALERLISDAELRRSMGKAGRQRVEECFSLDSCVEAYEALFQEVLECQ